MEATFEGIILSLQNPASEKSTIFPTNSDKPSYKFAKPIEYTTHSYDNTHLGVSINDPEDAEVVESDLANTHSNDANPEAVAYLDSKPDDDFLITSKSDLSEFVKPETLKEEAKQLTPETLNKSQDQSGLKDLSDSLESLFQPKASRLSLISNRACEMTLICKKKLSQLKSSVINTPRSSHLFENAVSRSRAYLQLTFQTWDARRERVLRNWMDKVKASSSLLYSLLQEIWENA